MAAAVRQFALRLPTYITIKDVKKRWGHGQEDIFPVSQFEKLWGDMSAIPGLSTAFFVVPRQRGQQLKDPAQLDVGCAMVRATTSPHCASGGSRSICGWLRSKLADSLHLL